MSPSRPCHDSLRDQGDLPVRPGFHHRPVGAGGVGERWFYLSPGYFPHVDGEIAFGVGIQAHSVRVYQTSYGHEIRFGSGESIRIEGRGVVDLRFADGTLLSAESIYPGATFLASEGNDSYAGTDGADTVDGLGGNDRLWGRGGNDTLSGSAGDDKLFGDAGDDRLIWNPGDDSDRFEGGDGFDTAEVQGGNGAEATTLTANGTRVRFDRLTPTEKRYLRAMAEIGPGPHRSGDIAEMLGRPVTALGPTRAQLIAKGMVWSPSHGDTAFTVPLFDGFMRRIMPGEAWRG